MSVVHSLVVLVLLITNAVAGAMTFIHPGIYNSEAELEFIRTKVNTGQEPWTSGWNKLRSGATSKLDYQHRAWEHVVRGGSGQENYRNDARAAYEHALQWYITRNEAHAQKVAAILDDWGRTFRTMSVASTHDPQSYKLLTGQVAGQYMAAGEIVRHTWSGWTATNTANAEKFGRTMYGFIKPGAPTYNGNWDASMTRSMLAIGVFCNDAEIWDYAVRYFRGEVNPNSKGALKNYIYPTGECQETCRDQAHTQMGIGELAQACEIAWQQGLDLYGELDNRLALGLEYTAKVLNGVPQNSSCGIKSAPNSEFYPCWELPYNHYHNRRGMTMEYTGKCALRSRPSGAWLNGMFMHQTLTHAELPASPAPPGGAGITAPSAPTNRMAVAVPERVKFPGNPSAYAGFSSAQALGHALICFDEHNKTNEHDDSKRRNHCRCAPCTAALLSDGVVARRWGCGSLAVAGLDRRVGAVGQWTANRHPWAKRVVF